MWIETKEPYKDCRVYGVYWNKDGRSRVAVIFPNGKKKTVSYPKFLMEVKLGRFLEKNETVDHIDGNPRNNDYSNLRILKRDDHAKVEVKRLKRMQFKCPMCGKTFWLSGKNYTTLFGIEKEEKWGHSVLNHVLGDTVILSNMGR